MKHLGWVMLVIVKNCLFVWAGWLLWALACWAAEPAGQAADNQSNQGYYLQAGDVIELSVWKEPDLTREILIGPDGFISIPLIGAVEAKNKTLDVLRVEIKNRLSSVVNEPSVNISLRGVGGSKIFVLGKVARPGEYPLTQPVDVLQALSKAGGVTPFADAGDIKIIRRTGQDQAVIRFNYNQVERGKHLEQNITLASGDTILVP